MSIVECFLVTLALITLQSITHANVALEEVLACYIYLVRNCVRVCISTTVICD